MNQRTIFLTGAAGFIGRNIKEQLGDKYRLYAPSSKELDLGDGRAVEKFFRAHTPDVVIHAAKIGGTRKIQSTAEITVANMRMFFNLVRCERYFQKMIFLGSGAEYDNSRPLIRVREEDFDKFVPLESFFFYKYACSKYIEKADNIVNLRLFGIYGKYEDYELRFISNAIYKTLFDLPITIKQNVFFDYLYINDFVNILDYFIQNKVSHAFYNVGTGKRVDLLTIANIVRKVAGKDLKIIVKEKGLNNEYTCDNTRLMRELPHVRFTDLEKSIVDLYGWYQTVKPSLKRTTAG